jgi:arginyl-tRNA synthetase
VLTADVRRVIRAAAQDAAAAGDLPALQPPPGEPADPSTLRAVPAGHGGGPGRYASTLPYLLAAAGGTHPGNAAAILAARLTGVSWIAGVSFADGHLTVAVTEEALAGLAVRIPMAGDCARSDILRGLVLPAPAPGEHDARVRVVEEITRRLAAEAGARIFTERAGHGQTPADGCTGPGPAALGYAGRDAVRYALITAVGGRTQGTTVELPVKQNLDNPVYAVRYAHAHAAATLRQAADLGLGLGEVAEFVPRLLAHRSERALLGALSWLPERVARAARRGLPGDFARYLEELAGAYHDCRESCPALPFGGRAAPGDERTTAARLWLVTAARTAIAAGLGLLGISAPDRM